jgi:major type 1 subunit fimbrin (pilin)
MKKNFKIGLSAASVVAALAALPAAAQASDGTVNITGSVTGNTCSIDVNNSGSSTGTVVLPTVTSTALGAAGQTAGATYFTIKLSSCEGTAKNVRAFFEQGPNVDPATFNLKNSTATGSATGVQVQLLTSAGAALKIGDASQRADGTTVALANNAATLTYGAQYYATAAAGTGTVSTSVTYSIDYL